MRGPSMKFVYRPWPSEPDRCYETEKKGVEKNLLCQSVS